MTDASTALEKRRQNGEVAKPLPILEDIRRMQKEFQLAMPRGQEADQLVRDAITAVRTIKHLAECDSASVLGSLMTIAQLGLRIGVLGQAWPIPFREWNAQSKQYYYKAQLIIGYQGYIELAHRSDKVQSIMPRTVYENDIFDIDYGINGTLIHKPARGPRGTATGYHCISRYTNGGYDFTYMSVEEIEEHRDRFAMAKKKINGELVIVGPWRDNPEPMSLKTVVRRHVKYIPKSPELVVARFVDGGIRINPASNVKPEDSTVKPAVIDAEPDEIQDSAVEETRPISEAQRNKIMALSGEIFGPGNHREDRLAYIQEILQRPVTTTNELTTAEASQVIDAMESFAQKNGG